MSSEQEESADPNVNSMLDLDQSLDEKGNGLREHVKPRRRRRGKRRKQKKESASTCEAGEIADDCEAELHVEREHENHEDSEFPEWDSEENLSCDYDIYKGITIRPIVPSAPLNSTQFIMDDHDDCRFYMSFESPNSYGFSSHADSHLDGEEGDIIEPFGDDAAYIDIDYQYESPQDFDNSAYYDKEFELSYKNNRFEELLRLSRNELINRIQSLESRFKELTEDLVKENPSPILENLQTELLELQERNIYLKKSNSKLTALLQNESDCSETLSCQAVTETVSVPHDKPNYDYNEDVYKECHEPEEVVMSDINAEYDIKVVCDNNFDLPIHANETDAQQFEDSEIDGDKQYHNKVDEQPFNFRKATEKQQIEQEKEGNHLITDSDHIDHSETVRDQYIDCEDKDWQIDLRESYGNKQIDHSKMDEDRQRDCSYYSNQQWDENSDNLYSKELKSEKYMSGNTAVTNSEGVQTKHIHSNSHKVNPVHCQPNNRANDDLRTLSVNTSELFHIANQTKCSSLVPLEGGMSPSETSVN